MGTEEEAHVVRDLATLRTLFDPLRLRILELLREPKTAKELAAGLGLIPNKLYYHLRRLEDHGLVVVDGSGSERSYRIVSNEIAIAPELRPSAMQASAAVSALFDAARSQIEAAMRHAKDPSDGGPDTVLVSTTHAVLTPAKLRRYQSRLRKLLEDLHAEPRSRARDAASYAVLLAIFPSADQP
jgi:DNA-binding transcriptional ArsR family regulator